METPQIQELKTAEDLLAALRRGNSNKALEIGLGDLKVPCRLLSAVEELRVVQKAKMDAFKANPSGTDREIDESYASIKAILFHACTINGAPGLPQKLLDLMSKSELLELHDQYESINHTINPNFEELKPDQIAQIVQDIKKKKTQVSDYYSWQLAAIGKFFLAEVLPTLRMDNAAGSN